MVSKAKVFNKCIIYQEPYIKYDHPLTQIFAQHRDEQFKMLNSNRGQCFVSAFTACRLFTLTLLLLFLLVLREEEKMGSQCELDLTAEPG